MKDFRKVCGALLSLLMAFSLSSCLDSSDSNTVYISGTGTATSTSTIRLDNGLILKTSDLSLTWGSRIYIYASADQDEYNSAVTSINNGSTGSVNLSGILSAGTCERLDVEDVSDDLDAELENITCTNINSISWLSFGAFGNGYFQFTVNSTYYMKKSSDSSSYTLVSPEYHCYVSLLNKDELELVIALNNKASQCLDESGKLLSGYSSTTAEMPISVDASDLYSKVIGLGLSDTDKMTLTVKYVTGSDKTISSSGNLSGTLGYSTNYFYVSSLKNLY